MQKKIFEVHCIMACVAIIFNEEKNKEKIQIIYLKQTISTSKSKKSQTIAIFQKHINFFNDRLRIFFLKAPLEYCMIGGDQKFP